VLRTLGACPGRVVCYFVLFIIVFWLSLTCALLFCYLLQQQQPGAFLSVQVATG
jgi:hypothetical protein